MTKLLIVLSTLLALTQTVTAAEQLDPFAPPMPLYSEGPHYRVDFPATVPDKPTVIEFFSFGCPHCFTTEAQVNRWLATKPANINFIKVPVGFGRPQWTLYAKAYYIAVALKVEKKFIGPFFSLIHTQKQPPNNIADVKRFFLSIGVSAGDFDKTLKKDRFFIENSMKQANKWAQLYKVAGVPDFLINKKYRLGKEIRSEKDFQGLLNGLALKDFK